MTVEYVSEFFHAAEWAKCVENPKSQGQKSPVVECFDGLQGLPQRNMHQFVLREMAPSRMLLLQYQELLPVLGKVLVCASPGWWTTLWRYRKNDDKSAVATSNKHELHDQAGGTHRWLLEHWWVTRLVTSLDRFHSIYFFGRKNSRRIYVVRVEINEKTADIQARSCMARTLGQNGKERQAEREAKVVEWKAHLENERKLRGIYFLDRRIRNSEKPSRLLARNLETPMALAMPCKTSKKCKHRENRGKPMSSKQNFRVSGKPVNPHECVW